MRERRGRNKNWLIEKFQGDPAVTLRAPLVCVVVSPELVVFNVVWLEVELVDESGGVTSDGEIGAPWNGLGPNAPGTLAPAAAAAAAAAILPWNPTNGWAPNGPNGPGNGRAWRRSFSISASLRRFSLARRFWNQILTWVSVSESELENSARSAMDKYCFWRNLRSNERSCWVVKGVRGLRFDLCFRSAHFTGNFGGSPGSIKKGKKKREIKG